MSETWDLSLSLIPVTVLRTFPGLVDWDDQLVSVGIFSSFFEGVSYLIVVQIGAQVNSNGIWGKLLVVRRLFLGVTRHVFLTLPVIVWVVFFFIGQGCSCPLLVTQNS